MNQPVSNVPRSCEELGLCQMQPFCQHGCVRKFPFAPGVIDGPVKTPRSRLGLILYLAVLLFSVSCVIAVVGFASGYLQTFMWPGR